MVNVVDPIQVRGKVIPADELSWRFSRSSGPGGQSVNTSDSRVELSYDVAASIALGPALRERALAALADRLVNGVLTVTASPHSAINGPTMAHNVTPVITLPLMKPRPCSVQTTPAMAISAPAIER